MSNQPIPFLDLVTPHQQLKGELMKVVEAAFDNAGFIGGPAVQAFEEAFARYCDTSYCVGVGDGTKALTLAFKACGVQAGDLIVTVPHTFIATVEAISHAGASAVFVDIDEQTCTMDPNLLRRYLEEDCDFDAAAGRLTERKSGRRVSAIVPVHLYGHPADMDPIMELAERYGLIVVEDSCQAHGAEYFSQRQGKWLKCGSMGRAAAFSFYPGKNLGACGEGGAVTTNDEGVARQIRMLRDHGQAKKYYHDVEGYNGRLDAIQAGFLSVKLPHMPAWTEQRREAARVYGELFAETSAEAVRLPSVAPWAKPVYHLYVVRVADRESLMQALAAVGIGTAIHYPIPLHLQKAYANLGIGEGSYPVTERVASEIVSLPMFPGLRADQQERVVQHTLEHVLQRA